MPEAEEETGYQGPQLMTIDGIEVTRDGGGNFPSSNSFQEEVYHLYANTFGLDTPVTFGRGFNWHSYNPNLRATTIDGFVYQGDGYWRVCLLCRTEDEAKVLSSIYTLDKLQALFGPLGFTLEIGRGSMVSEDVS